MKFNKKKEERKSNMKHTLPKLNLILIAISFVLIVIGFALERLSDFFHDGFIFIIIHKHFIFIEIGLSLNINYYAIIRG